MPVCGFGSLPPDLRDARVLGDGFRRGWWERRGLVASTGTGTTLPGPSLPGAASPRTSAWPCRSSLQGTAPCIPRVSGRSKPRFFRARGNLESRERLTSLTRLFRPSFIFFFFSFSRGGSAVSAPSGCFGIILDLLRKAGTVGLISCAACPAPLGRRRRERRGHATARRSGGVHGERQPSGPRRGEIHRSFQC